MHNNHTEIFQNLATKFRKLAEIASDEGTAGHLRAVADEYEAQAASAARVESAQMTDLICYRYRTPVLTGPWRRQPERALEDAIAAGQVRRGGDGDLLWTVSGEIEESPCQPGAACGGIYPSAD